MAAVPTKLNIIIVSSHPLILTFSNILTTMIKTFNSKSSPSGSLVVSSYIIFALLIEPSSTNIINTTIAGNVTCNTGSAGVPENCTVYCQSNHCAGNTITCPLFGDCYIECTSENGCLNTVIDATQQNGNFELYCDDVNDINDWICEGINVQGSTLPSIEQTGSSFRITCGRDRSVCRYSNIKCAQGMDCEIDCHQRNIYPDTEGAIFDCDESNITGPTDYVLTVHCDENNACQSADLHAEDSSKLVVTCANPKGCCGTSFYCPVNATQDDMCQIEVRQFGDFGYCGSSSAQNIYARNGFRDVIVTEINPGVEWSNGAKMYCGIENPSNNWEYSCDLIKTDLNACNSTSIPDGATCDNPPTPTSSPTTEPTIEPTDHPTADPIIKHPTCDPTTDPTSDPTMEPTLNPSIKPTSDPTIDPTSNPTIDPTDDPTSDPTADPSSDPTSDPTIDPTSHPSADPTRDPTLEPTEPCNDWTIEIEFTIENLQDNRFKTQQELWNLCLQTFRQIIYSNQSNGWCVQIFDIQFAQRIGTTDLVCDYQMNNELYNEYFIDYNESEFLSDFVAALQQNVTSVTISDPNEISDPPTSSPTNKEETNSDETKSDVLTSIINEFQIIIYAVIIFFLLLILVATIYSKFIKQNDFYSYSALIAVGIHFNDTLSDAFFCVNISLHDEYPTSELTIMLYLSMIFIILPASITIYQLYHQIKQWKHNVELSQCSFVAVKLSTANLFNLSLFDMPLSKSQSIQYQTKSIYSTIMFENLPQLAIQAWFIVSYSSHINAVVYASIIFSGLSLLITALSIVSQRDILQSQDYLSIEFDVTGPMKKVKHCRNRIKSIKAGIASILGLSDRVLEITRPMPIKNGLRIKINIYVNNIKTDNTSIEQDFNQASQNGQIIKLIMSGWKLNSSPHLSNIKYMKHKSRQRQQKSVTPDTQIELHSMNNNQNQNERDQSMESTPKTPEVEVNTVTTIGESDQDSQQSVHGKQNEGKKELSEQHNDENDNEAENGPRVITGMAIENANSPNADDNSDEPGMKPSNVASIDTSLLNDLWDENNNDKHETIFKCEGI